MPLLPGQALVATEPVTRARPAAPGRAAGVRPDEGALVVRVPSLVLVLVFLALVAVLALVS